MPALTISAVDHTAGTLTITAHGLNTGDGPAAVFVPAGGVIPTGLAPVTDVWVIKVDANTVKLASSSSNALAGTPLTFSDNGTLPLQLLVGIPYRNARTYTTGSQLKSADLMGIFAALIALWNWITGQAQSLFDGFNLAGPLKVGGQLYSFTDFTFTADSTTDTCTATAHPLHTGLGPLRNSNSGGGAPGGLPVATDWYAINTGANTFKAASSRANAIAGIAIDITTNGTGTQTVNLQPTTTRVSDAEVTRNLAVDGNLTVTGSSKHGLVTENIPIILPGNVALGNPPSNTQLQPSTGNLMVSVRLQVGKRILAVRGKIQDNTGTTITMHIQKKAMSGLTPPSWSSIANTSSAANATVQLLSLTGLTETVAAFTEYAVIFVPSGTNSACAAYIVEIDYDRP